MNVGRWFIGFGPLLLVLNRRNLFYLRVGSWSVLGRLGRDEA